LHVTKLTTLLPPISLIPAHTPVAPADSVAPNKTVIYKWLVPERSGPGAGDFSSVMWMYHSHGE